MVDPVVVDAVVAVFVVAAGGAVVVFVVAAGAVAAGAMVLFGVAAGVVAAGATEPVEAVPVDTPPWCEQAPRPAVPVVPSLQVTVVPPLVDAVAAGAAAGNDVEGVVVDAPVDVATPPWCEQAPFPVVVLVVPSLHVAVVAVACARTTPAVAATANPHAATTQNCAFRMVPPGEVPKLTRPARHSKLVRGHRRT